MKNWTILSALLSLVMAIWAHVSEVFLSTPVKESVGTSAVFAQVAVTMLGFLIAALSILATISGHRLLREMQRRGHYRVLLRKFFFNASAFGVAMLAAFVAMIFPGLHPISTEIAFGLFAFATLLLVDIGYRLWLVLDNLAPVREED